MSIADKCQSQFIVEASETSESHFEKCRRMFDANPVPVDRTLRKSTGWHSLPRSKTKKCFTHQNANVSINYFPIEIDDEPPNFTNVDNKEVNSDSLRKCCSNENIDTSSNIFQDDSNPLEDSENNLSSFSSTGVDETKAFQNGIDSDDNILGNKCSVYKKTHSTNALSSTSYVNDKTKNNSSEDETQANISFIASFGYTNSNKNTTLNRKIKNTFADAHSVHTNSTEMAISKVKSRLSCRTYDKSSNHEKDKSSYDNYKKCGYMSDDESLDVDCSFSTNEFDPVLPKYDINLSRKNENANEFESLHNSSGYSTFDEAAKSTNAHEDKSFSYEPKFGSNSSLDEDHFKHIRNMRFTNYRSPRGIIRSKRAGIFSKPSHSSITTKLQITTTNIDIVPPQLCDSDMVTNNRQKPNICCGELVNGRLCEQTRSVSAGLSRGKSMLPAVVEEMPKPNEKDCVKLEEELTSIPEETLKTYEQIMNLAEMRNEICQNSESRTKITFTGMNGSKVNGGYLFNAEINTESVLF